MGPNIIERARKHIEQSRLGANPRKRLYMDPQAYELIQELINYATILEARNGIEAEAIMYVGRTDLVTLSIEGAAATQIATMRDYKQAHQKIKIWVMP